MFRDYENPRALEIELQSLIESRARILQEVEWIRVKVEKNLCDVFELAEKRDILWEYEDRIASLEERINFAWQDEEYDAMNDF